jgi:hypothetical protein
LAGNILRRSRGRGQRGWLAAGHAAVVELSSGGRRESLVLYKSFNTPFSKLSPKKKVKQKKEEEREVSILPVLPRVEQFHQRRYQVLGFF